MVTGAGDRSQPVSDIAGSGSARGCRGDRQPQVVDDFPFRADKEDFLLWIGRLNDDKGPQRAIAAARGRQRARDGRSGEPPDREFSAREVEPHLDQDGVGYIGELGEEKLDLYARAAALLMTIRWAEPFGLVMIEAMACGTPVIAFPEGAAPELVRPPRAAASRPPSASTSPR